MLAGGTSVLFVILQAKKHHWDSWVCGGLQAEAGSKDLERGGLQRRIRIFNEPPQPEQ